MSIRSELHNRVLELRNMDRFVQSESFNVAYSNSTEIEKDIALKYINTFNKCGLIKWTKNQLRNLAIVEELPVMELRKLCCELGVRNYRFLTKISLITAIKALSYG